MKRIFCNNRLVLIAFFTVFSVAAAPAARASDNNSIPVELKFVRFVNNQPLFQLKFDGNAEQNEFTIVIRDEYSNVLYKENIKGENFSKTFLLNTDEIGDGQFQFEVISKKARKSVIYRIDRNTFYKNEVMINVVK